ncbi:hypothetical protein Hanom_Chr01g00040841 [Helianthus anomalus]
MVEGIVENWKSDDEIAGKFDYVEIGKGDSIVYTAKAIPCVESVDGNINDLRNYIFGNAPLEEVPNPKKVTKEVRLASQKWLNPFPLDGTQKRFI